MESSWIQRKNITGFRAGLRANTARQLAKALIRADGPKRTFRWENPKCVLTRYGECKMVVSYRLDRYRVVLSCLKCESSPVYRHVHNDNGSRSNRWTRPVGAVISITIRISDVVGEESSLLWPVVSDSQGCICGRANLVRLQP